VKHIGPVRETCLSPALVGDSSPHRLKHEILDLWTINYLLSKRANFGAQIAVFVLAFLVDRTNGQAIGTVLHPSHLSSSSVTLCIVAKRCVLEQKLLLTAYRKLYMRN